MTEETFEQLLDQARLPEDTVEICLRGDLCATYAALQRQLADIPDPLEGSGSLSGDPAKRELLQQLEAVASAMRRATQTFTLRALGKRAYIEFLTEHPPRPDDRRDMMVGYNRETMGAALILACLVDPKPTPAQWDKLSDVLSAAEWGKLDRAAYDLNFNEVSIPFSSAVSPSPQSFDSE